MSKPKKILSNVTVPDPVMISAKSMKVESTTGQPSVMPELDQEVLQFWKPLAEEKFFQVAGSTQSDMAYDLHHNLDELARFFRHELLHRSWLNAYLLAAGMNQVVQDYLRSDRSLVERIEKYAEGLPQPLCQLLAGSSRAILNLWSQLDGRKQTLLKIASWQHKLVSLVSLLAEAVMSPERLDAYRETQLVADGGTLLAYLPYFPESLHQEIVRLPSCFRSFDQRPEDLRRIVDEFTLHWTERERNILVVGVGTSGAYLAPFYAAILKSVGYERVRIFILHPDHPFTSEEVGELEECVRENELAVLCDAPPKTGSALTQAALMLEQEGLSPRSIILFLQLFGNYDSLPDELQKYPSVLLSWTNWSIHRQLALENVKHVLAEACEPAYRLSEVVRLPFLDTLDRREHVCALYQVKLLDPATGQIFTRNIQVKGAGLGYFGEHELVIAHRLPSYSAEIIALCDGLLYQEVAPPAEPLSASVLRNDRKSLDLMVNYILERSRNLPAVRDTGLDLQGREAVWEVASHLLSKTFSRGQLLARLPLIDAYTKELLKTTHPSIIDGNMDLRYWNFQERSSKPCVKGYLAEKDFSNLGLWCYDPVYDLASLGLEIDPEIQPAAVRQRYEAASGEPVSPETWMLYQLVQLWDQGRQDPEKLALAGRRMAQVVQRYFSEIYFRDLEPSSTGPLCAIEIDDVLETKRMGFSSLTPAGAKALRALAMHGFRVLLTTGRSLGEVKERCAAYHLSGGVAEYGAALYEHVSGQVRVLLSADEQGLLNKVRGRLSNKRGIYIDNDYRFAIRAYCLDEHGERMCLQNETVEQIFVESGTADRVYAIQGDHQTDFMVKRLDKGAGLRAWLATFGMPGGNTPNHRVIEMAVGDSASDVPMFSLARRAFAPANASVEVKQAGVHVTARPYQRGLEQAVARLVGHTPGGCNLCRQVTLPPQTTFMQDLLSVQENGQWGMVWKAIRLLAMRGRWNHVRA